MLASFPNARFAFSLTRDGAKEFELVVRALIEGLHTSLSDRDDGRGSKPRRRRRA